MPLRKINGIDVLELVGTPEEMGTEHGAVLTKQVHMAVGEFLQKSEQLFEVPYTFLREGVRQCEPFIPTRYVREMKALAAASGVSYEEILALNCLVDVDASYMRQLLHCCNFVVGPPASRGNRLLHGRNLDFPHGGILPRIAYIIIRRPKGAGRVPTCAVGWAGHVGFLTGYNADKISIAEVGTPASDVSLQGCPLAMLLRETLETCSTLEACRKVIERAPRTCGYNIAVCSGSEAEAIGLECTATIFASRKPRRGVLVVDNVCLCSKTSRNRLTHPAGTFRHARMTTLIMNAVDQIDESVAMEFLRDRFDMAYARANGRGYNCICNEHTVQSVLFLPAEERLYIAHGHVPAPLAEYKMLDLRCLW